MFQFPFILQFFLESTISFFWIIAKRKFLIRSNDSNLCVYLWPGCHFFILKVFVVHLKLWDLRGVEFLLSDLCKRWMKNYEDQLNQIKCNECSKSFSIIFLTLICLDFALLMQKMDQFQLDFSYRKLASTIRQKIKSNPMININPSLVGIFSSLHHSWITRT